MKKIKVLHIIKSLGRGGAEMLLPETLRIHDRNKFDFHYIYFLPWKDQMVQPIKDIGGKVTCFSSNDNIRLLLKFKEVVNYCREHDINVIHCHLPWAGFLGRVVYKRTSIPVLYTEHNMQERYHKLTKIVNKVTFNSQTLALAVSEDVKNSIQINISPTIPIKTLLNGVNTKNFKSENVSSSIRMDHKIPDDAVVIGTVAVFRFQKRLKEWLQVFAEVHAANSNVYGFIVGAGPLEGEIKAEFTRLNLEGKVFFPGLQTEVKPYLKAMDIFMMCSSFEGLPIALLEAMSMECAVVSTMAGGIKEVIRHKKDGLTCQVEEWRVLSEFCQILINDSSQLKTFKTAARERVMESFSLTNMVDRLEEFYEAAILG